MRAAKIYQAGSGKWEQLHRERYRREIGPIPEGMLVSFKDGNTLNCEVDNLVLISRQENMKRNTIHNYPQEVKNSIRTLSKLKKKIKSYEKQNQ